MDIREVNGLKGVFALMRYVPNSNVSQITRNYEDYMYRR